MGADTFYTTSYGKDAKEAFRSAVEEARYEHGHGGYTGTIAEKDGFVLCPLPSGINAEDAINIIEGCVDVPNGLEEWADEYSECFGDKLGPAVCIKVEDGKYVFIGFAPS